MGEKTRQENGVTAVQESIRDPVIENLMAAIPGNPLKVIDLFMIRDGLSVSGAIRKYTSLFGLPAGF